MLLLVIKISAFYCTSMGEFGPAKGGRDKCNSPLTLTLQV